MKQQNMALCALAVCLAVLLSACGKKQETPFTQPVQGAASTGPFSSAASSGARSDAQTNQTHPFANGSAARSGASSGAAASSSGGVQTSSSANAGGTASSSQEAQNTSGTQGAANRGATVSADGGLRLRATASTDGEKLLTIPNGTHLVCSGWQNGWAKTTYDGQTGYVSADYLLFDGKVSADGGLRLRSGPGETYEKLLTIPDGTTLAFTEQKDGWLKTTYNGKTGYVSQAYVRVAATVNAGPGLNLRGTASESGTKLTVIPNGAAVQCIGAPKDGWVKVAYSGYEGYVTTQYLAFS